MKKFMRIALVFALAGATLVGCTKDYSGDISDLNKKVSEQQSAVTALQTAVSNAQAAADNALASAQNALKEAQAAAKAAADANNDEEVAALTERVAAIEGEIAELEAKVEALDGLEAKLNEVAEQLKKDVNAKVDAALEELQAELDKALAQIDGAFSIKGIDPYYRTEVDYYWSEWNPGTVKAEKERFAKLAKAFPELAEIEKGEVIDYNTGVPFIVTPSTLEFDETDTFTLVDFYGQDFGFTLGNPVASPFNVKAGTAGVWFVDVLAPAYDKYGDIKTGDWVDLALVVERANGAAAQTSFEYEVYSEKIDKNAQFTIGLNPEYEDGHFVEYSNVINIGADKFENDAYDIQKYIHAADSPLFGDYFVIEPTNVLQVEKYGVSVDGSEITILNRPEAGESAITVNFMITAVGMNGKTAAASFTLIVAPEAIAPNAELTAKTVTLGYANRSYDVNVDYAVEDFGLTPLEWDTVFNALDSKQKQSSDNTTLSAYFIEDGDYNYDDENNKLGTNGKVSFLKSNKQTAATVSTDAKYIRFTVNSAAAIPGEYSVKITDGAVFCAVGNVTVVNPEASAIKLVPALCKDGVLQIVGDSDGANITYDLTKALVYKSEEATDLSFTDVAYKEAHDYDPATQEKNWLDGTAGTFKIGVQTTTNKQLYTAREFEVEYYRFGNENNKCTFNFTAEAISPIYSAEGASLEITDASIFFEPTTPISFDNQVELNKIIGKGTYVAGTSTSQKFNVLQTWKGVADTKTYTYDPTKNKSDYVAAQFGAASTPTYYNDGTTDGAAQAWNDATEVITNWRRYTFPTSVLCAFWNASQGIERTGYMGSYTYTWRDNYYSQPKDSDNAWIKDNAGEFIILDKTVSNVLRGFGLKDAEIVAVQQSEKPLYLTEAMVNLAFTAWQKYYNNDGTKRDPARTIADADKNAVAAYESIKESFLVVTKHTSEPPVVDEERSTDVDMVTVKFDDKLIAAKFIQNAEGFENPYEDSSSAAIVANPTYDIADLEGKTSVDVTGTVEVKDAWGMTTKKAFKVTCKINPAR